MLNELIEVYPGYTTNHINRVRKRPQNLKHKPHFLANDQEILHGDILFLCCSELPVIMPFS